MKNSYFTNIEIRCLGGGLWFYYVQLKRLLPTLVASSHENRSCDCHSKAKAFSALALTSLGWGEWEEE